MKKFALIIFTILLSLSIFVSCDLSSQDSNNTESKYGIYNVLVYDYSDSLTGVKYQKEYEFADHDKYDSKKINQKIEILIDGKQCTGEYRMTQYRGYNYFPGHTYWDPNRRITFEVDDSNMLTACFWGRSQNDLILSEDECINIVIDFMKDKIDMSQYDISVTMDDEQRYVVEFRKYIGDMKTTDYATVTVQRSGDLFSYASFMLGKVTTQQVENTNVEEIIDAVYAKLDNIYAEKKEKYSSVEYSVVMLRLTTLKDGSAAYVCTVDIDFFIAYEHGRNVISDRVICVVMVD